MWCEPSLSVHSCFPFTHSILSKKSSIWVFFRSQKFRRFYTWKFIWENESEIIINEQRDCEFLTRHQLDWFCVGLGWISYFLIQIQTHVKYMNERRCLNLFHFKYIKKRFYINTIIQLAETDRGKNMNEFRASQNYVYC